jgi:myo-inositol 2-dehydrogenase/D-chiro-inositol 1-dehydrogenase
MGTPINVGLVGVGRIGQVHAETLARAMPLARLAALADINAKVAEETAARLGCPRWSTDPLELVNDPNIQAILIASPNDTHARLIIASAGAGKAIFCEKPIDRDLADTDRALAAVARAGVPLQVGFQRRYDAAHVRSRSLVEQGQLGRVMFAHSHTRDPEPPPAAIMAASGGVFRDTCVHDFDALRWLVGDEITEVMATASVGPETNFTSSGEADIAAITLRFAGGTIGQIDAVRGVLYGYDVRTELIGSKSSVMGGYHQNTPVTQFGPGGSVQDHVFWFPQRFGQAYADEVHAWLENVAAGRPVTPTGADGRQALVLAIAAEESVKNGGHAVRVPAPVRS